MQDRIRKPVMIAAIALIVVLLMWNLKAFGVESNKSYILVADCWKAQELGDVWIAQSSLAAPYLPYVGEFDVVCAPFVKEPLKTREYLALLRTAEPTTNFVFVYDIETPIQKLELRMFFAQADGQVPEHAQGRAFIDERFAVAVYSGEVVMHELAHLVLEAGVHCNTYDPAKWRKTVTEC